MHKFVCVCGFFFFLSYNREENMVKEEENTNKQHFSSFRNVFYCIKAKFYR